MLVLMVLFKQFRNGPDKIEYDALGSKFLLILYFLEAVPITDQLNRF